MLLLRMDFGLKTRNSDLNGAVGPQDLPCGSAFLSSCHIVLGLKKAIFRGRNAM